MICLVEDAMIKSGRLTRNVKKFVKWMEDDNQTRSRSWVHCRQAFLHRPVLCDRELALHLAFFLASWGMYRPTSFLLQKDFMVHLPAVRELKSSKFNDLWHMTVDHDHEDATLCLTLKLRDALRTAYLPKPAEPEPISLV
jgi:hypothetical protein